MKGLPLAILLASSLGATATSASAGSREMISFGYKPHELVTEQGREALLERLKATTQAACRGIQATSIFHTPKGCRDDLERQFLAAIGSSGLAAQHEGEAVKIARSGS
jgi:UrcA family protein